MSVGTGSEVPWAEISAVLIGIGTSLVLDEFALILHLQDVYWADEGRISVEMVSLAVACLGLAPDRRQPGQLLGRPAGQRHDRRRRAPASLLHLLLIVLCVAKGKYKWALFGTFIPVVSVVGAVRLARPNSRWAKRRYSADKLDKAKARAAQIGRPLGRPFDWAQRLRGRQAVRPRPEAVDELTPAGLSWTPSTSSRGSW